MTFLYSVKLFPASFSFGGYIDIVFFNFFYSLDGAVLLTIARPTSALFNDPTSLVPSPVIIVTLPSLFSWATMSVFWFGEVLLKTWMWRTIWPTRGISKTFSSMSPLTHSRYCFESVANSCGFEVLETKFSSRSAHFIYALAGVTLEMNKDRL